LYKGCRGCRAKAGTKNKNTTLVDGKKLPHIKKVPILGTLTDIRTLLSWFICIADPQALKALLF
jgi:hypothetical protein